MNISTVKSFKKQLYQIAAEYGICKIFVFGSTARDASTETSDIDLLIEMNEGASAYGVGGFQYEAQKLLGVEIDVIPTFVLPHIKDQQFVQAIQSEAVTL